MKKSTFWDLSFWALSFWALSVCGVVAVFSADTFAADPVATGSSPTESQRVEAQQVAVKALEAEAEGDFLARQRLLKEAELLDGECALARSQNKEVRVDNGWMSIDECIDKIGKNGLIAEYERLRGANELTIEQHYMLADWCLKRQLTLQAYGHLNRIIQLDPDHEPALRALGYQQVGTEWISPAQLQEARLSAERTQSSIAKFGKQLQEIHRSLMSQRQAVRESAAAKLNEIDDEAAVPAVDSILSSPLPSTATLVVNWLASIDSLESSHALTRYALFHPDMQVRNSAKEKLKARPLHDFVPELIDLTVSPVAAMLVPMFNADGTLAGYRQAFTQEGAEKNNLIVVDTTISRFSIGAMVNAAGSEDDEVVRTVDIDVNIANRKIEQAVNQKVAQEAAARQARMQQANAAIQARNVRIAELLSFVSGEEVPSAPQGIWQWWDKYNETNTQLTKGTKLRRAAISHTVPRYEAYAYARMPEMRDVRYPTGNMSRSGSQFGSRAGSGGRMGGFSGPIQPECFVAGTKVMTHKGLADIERIRTGDLVLSREIESGTLAWKPVVVATQRPPEDTREIQTSSEALRCTGGHLFWVSGKGWEKASEIKPGDVLHGASEPTVVISVKSMPPAPTFNLGVADNANYFVGKEMVLTHDVTKRESTKLRVPGLRED